MMRREKIEHILRAAGDVTGRNRFVLVGSAAVIAWRAIVPDLMAVSRDIDLFAYDSPDVDQTSMELDGSLGQGSMFDQTFGYYCDGVGAETAILPQGWETRAKEFTSPNTNGVVAIVPEPSDIALAKLCAWRPKDIQWLSVAAVHHIIDLDTMRERLGLMPPRAGDPSVLSERLDSLVKRMQ